ncbi:hypothetical protein [Acinetobacter bouvetii]|uniref:Uncharacterized protein n=1 Tax=Acinetobacter bouvetii TaxID=202951 RepID=A0A811GDM7_9GAMM|nr:hypothetical protein [Acinetobacter bouvetii]CAB1221761.1 hypothetical protein SFB21_2975 [Acinetobacter bouvetii]
MEGNSNPSKKSVITPSEPLFDSMNQTPVKHTLINAESCDTQSRACMEQALSDPIARIPNQFKSAYHKFQYYHQKKYLRQVNYFAQLAFLIYFWADYAEIAGCRNSFWHNSNHGYLEWLNT